ncbi:CocE/NonD family hydrolase [Brevibacterium aurantiacum]|uniref:CocE/NonD family hydrolase n=1 Tax=Brevibacterium aurantiacum TaxID=273384 RepID=UPI0018669465|nr:CocE/NonD family hydrolase [Brevibacterium aurantiacum]
MTHIRRHVPLLMRDGVRLSANVHFPDEGQGSAWPVIFATNPYSKDSWFGPRTTPHIERFTAAGYAVAVVDLRGSGGSEGDKADAFERVEAHDVYDSILAIANEEWSDGNIVAWGLSYGGITALKAGASAPAPLRAVVAIEGSTDPYEYEVARNGSVGLAMITAEWSTLMLGLLALPSDNPWLSDEELRRRIENLRPWHDAWLQHPYRDAYWQGREVDPRSITVPTLIFTGWRDTNVVGAWHDFERLNGPKRIVCGPWAHGMPEDQSEEPVDSVAMAIDWFDQHVKGLVTPLSAHPKVSAYIMGADKWRFSNAETQYTYSDESQFMLGDGTLLTPGVSETKRLEVAFDATVGTSSGFGFAAEPGNRRHDQQRSVVFTSPPVEEELDLVARPSLDLQLSAPDSDVDIVANLYDLAPDGTATFVSRAFRRLSNLPPYTGNSRVDESGTRPLHVAIDFDPVNFRLHEGHQIQLTLSAADFPERWPNVNGAGYEVLVGGETPSLLRLRSSDFSTEICDQHRLPLANLRGENSLVKEFQWLKVSQELDSSEVRIAGSRMSIGATLGDEPIQLSHFYEISAEPKEPSLTVLTTNTLVRAGVGARTRTVSASCRVTPQASSTSLSVTGPNFEDPLIHQYLLNLEDQDAQEMG